MKTSTLGWMGPFLAVAMMNGGALAHEDTASFWPNASFETGDSLNTKDGTPESWRREGSNRALCTVLSAPVSTGKVSLAVEDTDDAGYGEWFSQIDLAGKAAGGDTLELHWHELYDISGGEMRVTVLFWGEGNQIAAQNHFVVRGQSEGWSGALATSKFTGRKEKVVVPIGSTRMSVSLVSGGSLATTGVIAIDDLNVIRPAQPTLQSGNLWPNSAFEEGDKLDETTGTPTGWKRGGSNPKLLEVTRDSAASPTHSLSIVDTDQAGYGEWYSDLPLAGRASAGDPLKLQWFEAYTVVGGEMRVTVLFLSGPGAVVGERHFVVKGNSAGWPGHPHGVPFVKRNEDVIVPNGAATMRVSLVSGGSLATTGYIYLDDLSVAKPAAAEVVSNNFWPNPGFEEGAALDVATGTPAGWNRGGNGPAICQMTKAASKSPTHALIVRDDSATQFGEWYADLDLTGKATANDTLNMQWFEVFDVTGGEMRVSVLFLDSGGGVVAQNHFVTQGEHSPGWSGDLANASFQRRAAQIIVPQRAAKLRVSLVSGGSLATTGLMAIDDLSIATLPKGDVLPGNLWPNPTFEIGTLLDNPTSGQPAGWNRGGTNSRINQVISSNSVSPSHALAIVDDDPSGFGEWYQSFSLAGVAEPGQTFQLQWSEIYHAEGTMRFSFLFYDAANTILTQRHFTVNGDSEGWKGQVAGSTWTKRNESVEIPEGATRMQVGLVSGGGFDVTGVYVIDDFSVSLPATEPAEPLRITKFTYNPAAAEFTLEWTSKAGTFYNIHLTDDLLDWTNEIDHRVPATGTRTTKVFRHPGVENGAFFRVRVAP